MGKMSKCPILWHICNDNFSDSYDIYVMDEVHPSIWLSVIFNTSYNKEMSITRLNVQPSSHNRIQIA